MITTARSPVGDGAISQAVGQTRSAQPRRLRRCALLLAGAALTLLGGCNGAGAYPIDLFQEMHYQPSQRLQEPDRMSPPAGAVPHSDGLNRPVAPRMSYTFEDARDLRNPLARAQGLDAGKQVYTVNCAVCHGPAGRADSHVAQRLAASQAPKPVDFTEARAKNRTDGQLFWLISNGVGNMPPFGTLLTENERWAVVHVIRDFQGQ